MIYRLCGALFLIAGCSGIGLLMVHRCKKELAMLRQMHQFMENIICDIQYRLSALPQLLRNGEYVLSGELHLLIQRFITELESQIAPNAACCMAVAISCYPHIPVKIRELLQNTGNSFGRYDLEGQMRCLKAAQETCKRELRYQEDRLDAYSRCCRAYSLGAGVILALILI